MMIMLKRRLPVIILIVSIILLLPIIGCNNNYKEYTFQDGLYYFSFEVPVRYEISNTIDMIAFLETIPSETSGLTDEEKYFYENCPDFPLIIVLTLSKPERFSSREEVEEYNRLQSEKLGVKYNIIYDYEMLADYFIEQDKLYDLNYLRISREIVSVAEREGIQVVSSYSYRDELNGLESEIIDYELFFEYGNIMWNVSLVAPIFMKDIAVKDFNHIIKTFKIHE